MRHKTTHSVILFPLMALPLLWACGSSPTELAPAQFQAQRDFEPWMIVVPNEICFGTRGQTAQLAVQLRPWNTPPLAPPSDIRWISSDPDIVSVSVDGLVQARGKGEATIRAEGGGFTASARVGVGVVGVHAKR
ncbi:Ig domain-containing protein [Gemmatimonadota bacterium]